MVQLVQQWLSPDEKFKNPIIVQSTRLEGSAGLQHSQNPEEVGSNIREGMPQQQDIWYELASENKGEQA